MFAYYLAHFYHLVQFLDVSQIHHVLTTLTSHIDQFRLEDFDFEKDGTLNQKPEAPTGVTGPAGNVIKIIRYGVLVVIGASGLVAAGGIPAGRMTGITGLSKVGAAGLFTAIGGAVAYVAILPVLNFIVP